jgi:hypothetical protein
MDLSVVCLRIPENKIRGGCASVDPGLACDDLAYSGGGLEGER